MTLLLIVLLGLPLLALGGFALFLLVRPRGQRFDSAGVPIFYTEEGRGEPVVLLHGFAVSGDLNWRVPGVTSALAKELRVITPDLRGHGRSGKPHDARAYGTEIVQDVVRLLDHLRIDRAHIAGYSLGGFVALKLAASDPERLLSASVLGAGWEPAQDSAFLAALPRLAAELRAGKGIEPLAAHLGGERQAPSRLHRLWVRAMTRYFADPQALAALVESLPQSLPQLAIGEQELGRIRVPMLSIVGARDPLRASAEALRARVPDLSLRVVEGDHLTALLRGKVAKELLAFLRAHSALRPRSPRAGA